MSRSLEYNGSYYDPEKDFEKSGFAKSKPKMDEFKGKVYSTDDIERDLQRLFEVEKKHTRAISEVAARRLELTIGRNTEMNNWLGETAFTYQTHDFDDVIHHVDMVVEWHDDALGIVRLGIDVTTADPRTERGIEVLWKKNDITEKKIEEGRLHEVKYFKGTNANNEDFLGRVMIPRVVINIPAQRVNQFWESYMRLKKEINSLENTIEQGGIGLKETKQSLSDKKKKFKEYEEGLGFSYALTYQIVESLEDQLKKLKKNNAQKHVIDRTEHALVCSRQVLKEKEDALIKKYPSIPRINGVLDVSALP